MKYLEKEWNKKEGKGNKDFKWGGGGGRGQAESRGGCLKKRGGGAGTPLQTMASLINTSRNNTSIVFFDTNLRYLIKFNEGTLKPR